MPADRKYESKKDLLNDLAVQHSGYFSVREADRLGLTSPYLSHYRKRGLIKPAFRGVYRLVSYPPGEHEELTVVWLATDQEAIFSHETALQLYNLSDLLPNRIHISLPPSWRRRLLPSGVERHYIKTPHAEFKWVGDVPVTTVLQTLNDCSAAHVSPEFVLQAIQQARSRGLIASADAITLTSTYERPNL